MNINYIIGVVFTSPSLFSVQLQIRSYFNTLKKKRTMKKLYTLFILTLLSTIALAQSPGNSLHFTTNANAYIDLSTYPSHFLDIPNNDFTIEAWVKPHNIVTKRIIYSAQHTPDTYMYLAWEQGVLFLIVKSNGTSYGVEATDLAPSLQWSHVAATWDASAQQAVIYVNGVAQPYNSKTGAGGTFNWMAVVGSNSDHNFNYKGEMDELRIWGDIRTPCEITTGMHSEYTLPQADLISYYNFNQGVAGGNNAGVNTLIDIAGGHNGTLTVFPLTGTNGNWLSSGAGITAIDQSTTYQVTETASVCSGSSYTFPDGTTQSNITTQVMHTSSLQSVHACDSIVVTTVNVNPVYLESETAEVCNGGSYIFPDGTVQTNITSQASHNSVLQSINGCDSMVFTIVDVRPDYIQIDPVRICSGAGYVFPDGTVQSNITAPTAHTSNLQSVHGCDSIIVTNIEVDLVYNESQQASVCSGSNYLYPDGFMHVNITSQVSHTSSLQSVHGCDSTIVTTVDVNPVHNENETANICSGDSYTFPDGTTQNNITAQVVHTSSLQSIHGCDSTIVTTVDVNPVHNENETTNICSGDSYTFPDGTTQNNITAQVVHTSSLQSVQGCDSIVVTTVDVNPVHNENETTNICSGDSYTFPDGTTQNNITAQVVHTSSLQSMQGCDSTIVTTVDVTNVDVNTTVNGIILNANATGATYQWLDCTNGYALISGATAQSYTAIANGDYAVEVTINGCTDTSACQTILGVGLKEATNNNAIQLYPNPTNGQFNISGLEYNTGLIEVYNAMGQLIHSTTFKQPNNLQLDLSAFPNGHYYIAINTEYAYTVKQVLVHRK